MAELNNEVIDMADDSQSKGGSVGKKIGCGCGCGCLLIIIAIIGIGIYMYNMAVGMGTEFVDGFSEKGYEYIETEQEGYVIEEGETIDGDVVYMSAVIEINGTINGNVAAACTQLIINGEVNGDLDLMCLEVIIEDSGVVKGDINAEWVGEFVNKGAVEGTISGTIQNNKLDVQE